MRERTSSSKKWENISSGSLQVGTRGPGAVTHESTHPMSGLLRTSVNTIDTSTHHPGVDNVSFYFCVANMSLFLSLSVI